MVIELKKGVKMEKCWLTLKEAANYLGICTKTLRKYVSKNKVRGYLLPGGEWRFKKEDLDIWMDSRLVA